MLGRVGRFTVRRRRWVLAGTLAGVVAAGFFGGGVFGRLSGGGFTDPGSESSMARQRLDEIFGSGDANLVLLVTAKAGSVDAPSVVSEGLALTEELGDEATVEQAFSYWTLGSPPPLRSSAGSQALVLARIGGDDDQVDTAVEELAPRYTRDDELITVGIGVGIDYALFVVSRFREEMRAGHGTEDAVVRTVETAGRTVLFSALTVAISLSALLVFPMYFLRSFAYAGIAVVALAGFGAIVFLPSLLAVLGPRVDSLTLFRRKPKEVGEGMWHRIATFVMRRPWPVAVSVVAVLLLLGTPFLGVSTGLPDDRVLPQTASARQVQQEIRQGFSSEEASALSVVAVDAGPADSARDAAVDEYASDLSSLEGVARVDASTGSYLDGRLVAPPSPASDRFEGETGTWLAVVPSVEPISAAAERLVDEVRSTPAPFETQVSGPSAELVDSKDSLLSRLPLAAAIIGLVTLVLLFLMTGSVVVPLKAIVLNLLSLTATFGAMVWIFQEGNLSDLLGFTATGTLDTTTPILMFCIAFGLSMDYEVFLLSRIKEEYDRTGDNVASVAMGLERTGRIVTAAAALLAIVFIAFATSEVTFIKLFGVGMALAVIMDATLIRAALVPAFMRLAGRANWWAPKPLRRLHERIGLREAPEPVVVPDGPKKTPVPEGA